MKVKSSRFWLVGFAGGALTYSYSQKIKAEIAKVQKVIEANIEKPVLELKGPELRKYPWSENYNDVEIPEDWEFRKVRVRGELSKTTHFVYRERNGQKGYLVFKALVTARDYSLNRNKTKSTNEVSSLVGMMVNLGWVSEADVSKVGTGEVTYLKKYEPDEEAVHLAPQIVNPYTGVIHNAVTDDDVEFSFEGYDADEVILTGYLRKNEEPSFWQGRRFWKKENFTSVIDLEKLSATHGFGNLGTARKYYLEVALNRKLDKVKQQNIIIPSTFKESREELKDFLKSKSELASWHRKLAYTTYLSFLGFTLI